MQRCLLRTKFRDGIHSIYFSRHKLARRCTHPHLHPHPHRLTESQFEVSEISQQYWTPCYCKWETGVKKYQLQKGSFKQILRKISLPSPRLLELLVLEFAQIQQQAVSCTSVSWPSSTPKDLIFSIHSYYKKSILYILYTCISIIYVLYKCKYVHASIRN